MTKLTNKALLPTGLRDVLSPAAAHEVDVVEQLMATFAGHGYDRVKPPLIEFEDSLLQGSGLRPDITMQVARIAETRLAKSPRPLRLSYSGQVLRVRGSQLRPERQFGQVGAELIGSPSPTADVEVVLMAIEALTAAGLRDLSVDLGLPTLVPALAAALKLNPTVSGRLRTALNRRDSAAVAALSGQIGQTATDTFIALIDACGPAEKAIDKLRRLDLPPLADAQRSALAMVVEGLNRGARKLKVTIDLVELRGFEYHTGVTFAFFSMGARGELGRGGRYHAGIDGSSDEIGGEPATGLSLFMDSIIRALPRPNAASKLYLAKGTPVTLARKLRREGWATVQGLDKIADIRAEARRLNCSHVLDGERVQPLKAKKGR
jgi:ATP phosphoribosyltransferase regulatory subunit